MTESGNFTRGETVDKPGIIGARWWREGLETQVSRRSASLGLLAVGGLVAAGAVGVTGVLIYNALSPDEQLESRSALDMQREFGWNFGATKEQLTFDGRSTQAFARERLASLAEELAPASVRYRPYYVPTLFQSLTAARAKVSEDDAASPFVPLRDVIVPSVTPAMEAAYGRGRALAELLQERREEPLAVIVDLPGPEAVAFAAGAAGYLDPVFLFDNWPHPRGVVPAHQTLAAAAYYQPLFANTGAVRGATSPALFVLDRKRLAPYSDDSREFDNRHTARLPTAANLSALGVKKLLYIVPTDNDLELDDLVDEFLAYETAGVEIKILAATSFQEELKSTLGAPSAATHHYAYRGSSLTHVFWTDWGSRGGLVGQVRSHRATPRPTLFSHGVAAPSTGFTPGGRARPAGFGTVPVVVSTKGNVLGAKLSRSGSWNRSEYSSSGS